MRVVKYIPAKLYGFCQAEDGWEVFFHLAVFQPGPAVEVARCMGCPGPPRCQLQTEPPPPILGEWVTVESEQGTPGEKAPRASEVVRDHAPRMLTGVVESFDPQRRYGFVMGSDQVSYHLHESEITDGRMPLAGGQVVFFPGWREGRPRACHVKVCR
jgi:cold shock CspA family protein